MAFLTSTFLSIGSFAVTYSQAALFAFSIAFQSYQAGKMRSRQAAAAEARKGFELITEGRIDALPLVYGRCKIGGVRAFMETSSNFTFEQPDSDKTFNLGYEPLPERTIEQYVRHGTFWDDYTYELETVTLPATDGGLMSKSYTGKKNEYLFVQQALCMGPINAVYDIEIDERSIKDPSLVSGDTDKPKAAFRADFYYEGNKSCKLTSANFGHRVSATFPGIAYLSYFVRLDRDDPQFNSIPPVVTIMEGRKVRTVSSSGNLSSTRTYTANPAYCLLDYLLDPDVGAALGVDELDLMSFRAAATICDKPVLSNAAVGGPIWRPADGARHIPARTIPLYELNMALDTSKPIRENIEAILTCMGDARLVWSAGKYKLLMQYPESNAAIDLAGTLTDDDLVSGKEINISWPTTAERLNHATIRYHDEANWFKENSVSWPPKEAGVYVRGIGGRVYPVPPTNWGDNIGPHVDLLKSYGVWNTAMDASALSWKLFVRKAGVYTFRFAVDDSATGTVNGVPFSGSWGSVYEIPITVGDNSVVSVQVNVEDYGEDKGFAAVLLSDTDIQVWTSRSPAYQDMQIVNQTDEVYNTYLEEDNNVLLETDVFSDGITDYYHALAKAEELVRTSRTAFIVELSYFLKDKFFEPGDFIKISSKFLEMDNLIVRVSEVSVDDNLVVNLKGTRFDYQQLAWNVDDNVAGGAEPVWSERLPAPYSVSYEPSSDLLGSTSGRVVWTEVNDVRVTSYRIYYNPPGARTPSGQLAFVELGRSPHSPFDLPLLTSGAAIFGVRSASASGLLSAMTLSSATLLMKGPPPPKPVNLQAVGGKVVELSWEQPLDRPDGTPYSDHMATQVYRSVSPDVTTAKHIGNSPGGTYTDRQTEYGDQYYWVRFVSLTAVEGPLSDSAGPVQFVIGGGLDPSAADPPPPFDLQVIAGLSFFQLSWQNPDHAIGGGHAASRVYGAEWPEGAPEPDISSYQLLTEVPDSVYFFPAAIATRWTFIVREVSKAGGLSTAYAGPENAKTGKIGNNDLGEYIVDADKLADGAITAEKFLPGLEIIQYYAEGTSVPVEKTSEYISIAGILYYWKNGAYQKVVNALDFEGQILEAQIADNALTVAKFAQGIAPVELVDTLPTTGNFEGRVVSLKTQNGALYRYTASGWSASLAPSSVVAGTIAAGAVNTNELAANAVNASKIAAGAITADKIGARSITADRIAFNSLTGNEIAANAISAGHISSGAITAGKLAANAIVAGSAVIGAGAISEAMIGTAAITSAKIKDLEVDTVKIRGNAVTTMNYASGGDSTVTGFQTLAILGLSMVSGSSGVVITCSVYATSTDPNPGAAGWADMWVTRYDGKRLPGTARVAGKTFDPWTTVLTVYDSAPYSGYITYNLQMQIVPNYNGEMKPIVVRGIAMTGTGGKR